TFGIYGQDEWQVNDDFKVTLGLRFDLPMFLDDPAGVAQFDTTIAKIEAAGYDMEGANSGKMPKTQIMVAPRIGFNWDVNGEEKTQVRGGVGIFTSRIPLVWPGGSYTNNGVTVGGVYVKSSWGYDIEFQPDWQKQYTNADFGIADAIPSGQMDLFTENFKFPQVLRTSAAVDQKLPWWGLIGTVEGIFTKTLNNMLYYNVNQQTSDGTLAGADNRPHYPGGKIESAYTRIMLGTNTNKGYSYNFTVQLQKPFDKGFTGSIAYTYGKAMAMNDATSSQNSSQWRYMENVNGLNNLDLSYSDFSMGHRVVGFLSYKKEYANNFATGFSLFYDGISGGRYSYVYNDYGDMNGEGENAGNLIWIPANSSEIQFVGTADEQAQQWSDLDAFIEGDDYLKNNRGGYAERNAATLPFQSMFDFKLIQDFYITAGKNKHTLQVTFDIFNVANMLNKEWGARRYVTNTAYKLI
ncbi:MAG: TonB-dependent receptor, partial [Bacteroidales bacterium]|nr:TonB-dependent receptor [Bacteroidales bacterium]